MRSINRTYVKRLLSILVSVLLIITTLFPDFAVISYAYMNEENTFRGSNSFIEYLVDKNDGRFIIRTLEGVPQKNTDNNKKLLFERENDPETSFTTFRVNGQDYIFGNRYAGHSDKINQSVSTSDGLYTESHWAVDGLDIKQILEVIEDPEHPNVGNVRIRYEVTNRSNSPKNVGSRIFLDTMLGDNDGSSFAVSGSTITHETELSGEAVPGFYRSSDDDFAPKVVGYGFLKGWGQAAPDKVVFAHYNNLSNTKWEYSVDETLDFTTDQNIYEGADSSVAYYFNQQALGVNQTRIYETFYGIGDFSHYSSESDYAVIVNVPEKLTVNPTKTGYVEDPFTVSVTIDNSLPASRNLTNVNIALLKRDTVFNEVDGEGYVLEIPAIHKGNIETFEFQLSATNANAFLSEAIRADVTSDNNASPVSAYDYVLLPAISGALPDLRMEAMAPSTVYYEGYRQFSIKGKGFDMLTNKGLWELYLVDQNNQSIEIPDENISIENDEKLAVTLYENTLGMPTPVGDYRFKIVHTDANVGTVVSPRDKPITFSADKKYQSRPYGVLYVEKRNKDGNFTYHLNVVDSKEMLDGIKSSLENGTGVPALYGNATKDATYGPVEEIVLDVVGDVAQLTMEDGSKYYTVKTNTQTAILNSVIQYKDANSPLKIRKINEMITIEGDGTLQIVGGNEFWWTSFYTYIADGEEYEMDEIIEEPEEGEEEDPRSNIVIDFFDPGKVLTSVVKSVFDGFNLEINGVILLNEGASFGGKLSVEVPYGAPVPVKEEEKDPAKEEAEAEEAMFEALADLFLTDEERAAKTKKTNRSKAYLKISALLLTEDAIFDKIMELKKNSSAPPSEKAEIIYDLILQSPELLLTIFTAIKGAEVKEDKDGDRKSVGVSIDVKKVIVGKKYGEDYIYDSVRFIGIDAEGEVKVTLPFGTQDDRDEAEENDETQGVSAKVAVNTIDGEYSLDANVNLEIVQAHAYISILKVDGRLVPDHLELSGGFNPGIPVAPPFYINKVGGGVKNLAGQFGKKDSGPLTIIMILGINLQPKFEGEFRAEVSANGFSLVGDLGFENGGMKVFEKVAVALQWSRPRYFEAEAEVNLFDIIDGSAYLFVGEKKGDGDVYKFYFEGRVEAGVKIPDDVWFVGGKEIGRVKLGVSTEKFWGSVQVIGIGVGITYIYGKGIDFSGNDTDMPVYASLTNVNIPDHSVHRTVLNNKDTLLVGNNIRKIGTTKGSAYAWAGNHYLASRENDFSLSDEYLRYHRIFANVDNNQYTYDISNKENILFELKYQAQIPNLTVTDPSGNPYALVENENYMVKADGIYISVVSPEDGVWTIGSDVALDSVDVFEAKALPELETLAFSTAGNAIDVNFTSSNSSGALVSLFLVNTENEGEAGYALASNIDASLNQASVTIPEGAREGTYKIRATIQHPDYGYHELVSEQTLTITDPYKPSDIGGLTVSYIGDGYLKATWTDLVEDGKIQYVVTAYDSNNQVVQGFANMVVNDPQIIVGGSYTGLDAEGNEMIYSLDAGKAYKIGVTPVKTLTSLTSDMETVHLGNETISDAVHIKTPNKPSMSITYGDAYIIDGGVKYFCTGDVDVVFHSDQQVDTSVTVDGEYFATFKAKNFFTLPLEFIDGEHSIQFESNNLQGDTSSKTVTFITDTTKPEMMIDSPAISVISEDGTVLVKGMVESGAEVSLNDNAIATSGNGSFETTYTLSQNKLKETITIKAQDRVGNETVYVAEAINGTLKPITQIRMNSNGGAMKTSHKRVLSVIGIDEVGNEIQLDNSDMEFSIIKGNSLGSINQDGEVTAYDEGSMVVAASYALTDTYTLQDAIEIEIQSGLEYVQIVPEISELEVGESVQLSLVGGSKYEEVSLPPIHTVYRITEGNAFASLAGNVLTANHLGSITVEAEYNDGVQHAIDTLSIQTIPKQMDPSSSGRDHSSGNAKNEEDPKQNENEMLEAAEISIVDAVLEEVWRNLIEKEKDLEIISMREIREDLNTQITMHGIGRLEIPKGSVTQKDQFLLGIVKDADSMVGKTGYTLKSEVVELTFRDHRGKLENPINLIFSYDKAVVQNPEDLAIYYYNEQFEKWQYLGGALNQEAGEVQISLNHLSKYALMEDTSKDQFMDTANHFSKDYIQSLYSLGIVYGELSGGYRYYSPDRSLTRLEFAAIAIREYGKLYPEKVAGIDLDSVVDFEDEAEIATWGKADVKMASALGLIQGAEVNGRRYFMPNQPITRAEAFTIIGRAIGGGEVQQNDGFMDSDTIPQWSKAYIYQLKDLGIVSGYPDGTIKAKNRITRGEIAKIMYYWLEHRVVELK